MQLMVDSNAGREQKFFKGRQLTQVEMFVGAVVRDNPSGLLELSGRESQLIVGNTEVRLLVYSIQSEFPREGIQKLRLSRDQMYLEFHMTACNHTFFAKIIILVNTTGSYRFFLQLNQAERKSQN